MPLVADGGLNVRDAWTPPASVSAAAAAVREGSERLERYEGRDEVEAVREMGRGVEVGEGVRRDLDIERSVIMARPICERRRRRQSQRRRLDETARPTTSESSPAHPVILVALVRPRVPLDEGPPALGLVAAPARLGLVLPVAPALAPLPSLMLVVVLEVANVVLDALPQRLEALDLLLLRVAQVAAAAEEDPGRDEGPVRADAQDEEPEGRLFACGRGASVSRARRRDEERDGERDARR